MKVVTISDENGWRQLQPVWNQVVEASASASTFLTWEWLSAWWSAYGNPGDLQILTALAGDGSVKGIAPLRRRSVRRYGLRFPVLAFIGDGSGDSDYLDFVIERGWEDRAMAAFLAHCRNEMDRGVILQLNEMPAGSPNVPVLQRFSRETSQLSVEHAVPCATVALPDTWEAYLSSLRPRFRTKIRSVLRNMEGRADVKFGTCSSEAEIEWLLPKLFDLHTRRWNQESKPGVFHHAAKRQFYAQLSPLLLERGALRFTWLEWKEQVLACQYGFIHDGTYLHLQEGYEPAAEHWNVGLGLRAWTIREFLQQGVREYDFLAGVGRHKTDWGAEVKESRSLVIAAPTYANLVFCRGPEWQDRARDTVRKVVPERVLAARRDWLTRQPAANGEAARAKDLIRQAAASCYFHLRVPAATRLIRERYQVDVSPAGKVLHRSWAKRRQPAGRILYYHRVNDEGDPFFPSTPVKVFESQMRFVARRYKVVSLGALLEHLESDSPETLVAVTFDDGYRDNFENALPVLKRYGLPATIFLTTGSLDSREPLWFERLATALKSTSREFLDVELDLPRRFWLRTSEERLQANQGLFALLRRMADTERQAFLTLFLRELGPIAAPERTDMMLTWDQVRQMRQYGIDFGGHTVTHPYLSRLTAEQAHWELTECKRRIELELQAPVSHFAYPNGRDEDFAPWNKDALRAAGYKAAVTTLWGLNYRTTDRMELRRGGPWEEDEALFAYKMDWYGLVNG